jgi:hypothetical protein
MPLTIMSPDIGKRLWSLLICPFDWKSKFCKLLEPFMRAGSGQGTIRQQQQ